MRNSRFFFLTSIKRSRAGSIDPVLAGVLVRQVNRWLRRVGFPYLDSSRSLSFFFPRKRTEGVKQTRNLGYIVGRELASFASSFGPGTTLGS